MRLVGEKLSAGCKDLVIRVEKNEKYDVRLNAMIRKFCIDERKAFCGKVPPGGARALICLNVHKNNPGFGEACRTSLLQVKVDDKLVASQQQAEDAKISKTVSNALEQFQAGIKSAQFTLSGGLFGIVVGATMGCALASLICVVVIRRVTGRKYGNLPETMS